MRTSNNVIFIPVLILIFHTLLFAQVPEDYYTGSRELSGDSLKAFLHGLIKDHVKYPYTSKSTDTWDILKEADRDTNNAEDNV